MRKARIFAFKNSSLLVGLIFSLSASTHMLNSIAATQDKTLVYCFEAARQDLARTKPYPFQSKRQAQSSITDWSNSSAAGRCLNRVSLKVGTSPKTGKFTHSIYAVA